MHALNSFQIKGVDTIFQGFVPVDCIFIFQFPH